MDQKAPIQKINSKMCFFSFHVIFDKLSTFVLLSLPRKYINWDHYYHYFPFDLKPKTHLLLHYLFFDNNKPMNKKKLPTYYMLINDIFVLMIIRLVPYQVT